MKNNVKQKVLKNSKCKAIKDVPKYIDQLVVEFKTKKVDFGLEQPISIQMCLLMVPLIKPHNLQLSFTICTSQPHFYLLKICS